VVDLG
jgi:hypothetical protein